MAVANFITQLDLKNNTVIQNNIEAKLLEPFINVAQDIHIVKILGKALADVMLDDLSDTTGVTEATANRFKTLLPYVKNAHSYCTAAEGTPFLAVRVTNKGINRRSSDHSSPASENEVKGIQQNFANLGQWYKKELECFLIDNVEDYPEYREEEDCDNCKGNRSSFFSGFQFDKKKINGDLL